MHNLQCWRKYLQVISDKDLISGIYKEQLNDKKTSQLKIGKGLE